MAHSKLVNVADERIGQYLFQEIYRHEKIIEEAQARLALLRDMHKTLRVCSGCTGSGTVCRGRTEDDMPDYQPCKDCGGRGHTRTEI